MLLIVIFRRNDFLEVIQRLYNFIVKVWFVDKGDGVYDGFVNDFCVVVFEVFIEEVRYFYQEKIVIGIVIDVVVFIVKGEIVMLGDIR